jgi:dipeptidyl aminopeptidase/acylaminoacyl peptidase
MFQKGQKRKNSGFANLILVLPLIIVASVISYFVVIRQKSNDINPVSSVLDNNNSVTPTPFPFEEITIPYLRERSYSSHLGQLDKLSENSSYTSFVTSYTSDGLKINGLLTIPKSDVPKDGFPAVIFVHGYIPPMQYRTTQNYVSWIDDLAKDGFVVFKIDLRGHDNSEGNAEGAYYSDAYVVDTLNAYAALQDADFVNPQKIGLWGHSMAGNVLFRSFVVKQDIPAVVIWAGAGFTYSDLTAYRINDNSYRPAPTGSEVTRRRNELREAHGSFDPNNSFWQMVTPINYLDGVTGSLMVNHAVDDAVVSINYGRNLMKILDGTGLSHRLYEYPSGGHNLTGESFTTAIQRTIDFFKSNL